MSKGFERMMGWALVSVLIYAVACFVPQPQIQTVLWKIGHVTLAAHVGYFVDRSLFRDRVSAESAGHVHLRRAIVVAAVILGVSLGL